MNTFLGTFQGFLSQLENSYATTWQFFFKTPYDGYWQLLNLLDCSQSLAGLCHQFTKVRYKISKKKCSEVRYEISEKTLQKTLKKLTVKTEWPNVLTL